MATILHGFSVVLLGLYATASAWYAGALIRGAAKSNKYAKRTLQLALFVHVCHLVVSFIASGRVELDLRLGLSATALILGVVYLFAAWLHARLTPLGAFVVPVVLLLYAGSELVRDNVISANAVQRDALLTFHIAVNMLGLVAFVLAFTVSVAYLIQETMLRRKTLGGLFQRLPDLQVLDSLVLFLVTLGFPLLTLGIATGAMRSYRMHGTLFVLSYGQVFALFAWVCFAAVLVLRFAAGWRGRRAAIGTMIGFVCSMLVLLGYMLRGIGLSP